MKKAVIVCYTFPPFPGIGGRRWAKFAKYLHREGNDLQIVAAKKTHSEKSTWTSDIAEFQDKVSYIPSGYPQILTRVPKNKFERWWYRFALAWIKFTHRKGNYFDHSLRFGKTSVAAIEKHLKQGYKNVIVSCGPFRMAHDILQLKKTYPEVRFILDFRDPWANNDTSFGFQTISPSRRGYEYQLEKETLALADLVISVSDKMNAYFKSRVSDKIPDFLTIGNGFDKEDFKGLNADLKTHSTLRLTLVFTGTLYNKSEHVFQAFCSTIRQWIGVKDSLIEGVEIVFYGHVPDWFHKQTLGLENWVKFGGSLGLKEVYEKLALADGCLLFLTDDLTYSRSTKFYEYAAMEKPIIVCSEEGDTGNFVAENGLGFQCRPKHMEGDLSYMLEQLKSNTFVRKSTLDVSDYDVKVLAEKIQQELI